MKHVIHTLDAPQAIGTYSQAIKVGNTVYISGQIPLDSTTQQLVGTDVATQLPQVFKNLAAIAKASGGDLSDIVKLTVYLIDLSQFSLVNEIMATFFHEPYPARAAIGVAALPKGALVEIEAILSLGQL